jgi:hypothetical protein
LYFAILGPENLDAVTHVLLRQTYYLYEYEAFRLHGFIADSAGDYEACYRYLKQVSVMFCFGLILFFCFLYCFVCTGSLQTAPATTRRAADT